METGAMPRSITLVIAFAWSLTACRPQPQAPPPQPHGSFTDPRTASMGEPELGKASYYADSLAGNATASGEPYDPRALTAAHPTLPFGTVVDVVRRDDGRRVRVRINDRGPFGGRGRIIDVSRAAAEQLDMIRAGVIDVSVIVVEPQQ
jgi:rare lipoprotein A